MTATLTNTSYVPTVSGSFTLAGGPTGRIDGDLDTRQAPAGRARFYGSLTLSYTAADGQPCTGTCQFGGIVTDQSVSLAAVNGGGFTGGTCPDLPAGVRVELRR